MLEKIRFDGQSGPDSRSDSADSFEFLEENGVTQLPVNSLLKRSDPSADILGGAE
jgi:hypothetical protein